jgi:hypothetical protein
LLAFATKFKARSSSCLFPTDGIIGSISPVLSCVLPIFLPIVLWFQFNEK